MTIMPFGKNEAGWVVLPDGTTYAPPPHPMYLRFFSSSFFPHFLANQIEFICFYFSFFVSRAGVMVVVRFVGRGERATTAQRRAARLLWAVTAGEEDSMESSTAADSGSQLRCFRSL